jgi:hypothetical protein
MTAFGRLPRREDGGSDHSHQILAVLGQLLALPLFLWLEGGSGEGDVVFPQ